ncbi:protein cornichon homolog 4 isoform X4 [Trichogramma pretiosum]|uniref:Protein cornichon homolog 4 n=1 Tax=Trichogramma kaykai TaxID=54128 RepID=A0ABD2XHS9_9HYME|nr:protein cornichon homolog 4 isoform X4 [Trichogramma pretiosum]
MLDWIPEPLIFALAILDTGLLLFVLVYFVITLSDLECDYLNAQQCCSRLNTWVYPKVISHTLLLVLLLLHGQWLLTLANIPMSAWLIYEIYSTPKGNMGVYDPTEIHNRGQLKRHMRDCMIYLGYYLLFFFIYLYCLIVSLLKGDPINRAEDDNVEF